MSEPRDTNDDQAIEALLSEVFGKATPPDLSASILRRLGEQTDAASAAVSTEFVRVQSPVVVRSRPVVTAGRSAVRRVASWAAIAATFVGGFFAWQAYESERLRSEATIAEAEMKPAAEPVAPAGPSQPARTESAPVERFQPKGITIAKREPSSQPGQTPSNGAASARPIMRTPAEPLPLVANRTAETLVQYWRAVDVTPTVAAEASEIGNRLKVRIGVELDPKWLQQLSSGENPGEVATAIETAIRSNNHSRAAAHAWLNQITGGSINRLPEETRNELVEGLAKSLRGSVPVDRLLSAWFRGDDAQSSAWYSAVSSGGEYSMVHRVASLTMNVDLRCTRCHDSLIESEGRQQDYWSLTAMLRRDVRREASGKWTVRGAGEPSSGSTFYERRDGRQTLAEPGVPAEWLARGDAIGVNEFSSAATSTADVRQWSESLVGSRALARGLVNSLWRLVHDRPLRGQVADATSPPLDETLTKLEDALIDDLIASNFDVTRTLAVIATSPATTRSIPESLLRQDAWAVDPTRLREANHAVEAFAAAAPSPKVLPLSRRLEMAMRSSGATLRGMQEIGVVLAQPLASDTTQPVSSNMDKSFLESGLPDHVEGYPVQWLASLKDFDSQLQHLGYLAGYDRLPTSVEPAAKAMRAAEVAPELTLHRVWWLLQP